MSRTMTVDDIPLPPCPPWCEQIQCREVDPADRFHQRLMTLPVVYRETGGMAAAAELAVVTFTSAVATDEAWIGFDLGEDVASITVSLGSATRLLRTFDDALRIVTGVRQGIPPMAG